MPLSYMIAGAYCEDSSRSKLLVYREGNRCMDALAIWGGTMVEVFVVFNYPPSPDILYLVNLDTAGMYVNRITETDLTSSVR